jgi:hypothetical protein
MSSSASPRATWISVRPSPESVASHSGAFGSAQARSRAMWRYGSAQTATTAIRHIASSNQAEERADLVHEQPSNQRSTFSASHELKETAPGKSVDSPLTRDRCDASLNVGVSHETPRSGLAEGVVCDFTG